MNKAIKSIGALSIPDFVDWSGIGRSKVYEELHAGRLKAAKVGRKTLIINAAEWLAALPPIDLPSQKIKGAANATS